MCQLPGGVGMNDFTLVPPDPDDAPERSRPVRLVNTGLAPTSELPPSATKGGGFAAVYNPCAAGCGALVLQGRCDDGRVLTLDPHVPTYVVLWCDVQAPL